MKHFFIPEIDLTVTTPLKEYAINLEDWSYFGKGRFSIHISRPPLELSRPITKQFKNPADLFFKIGLNRVKKMGVVVPHTDHYRYVTLNIPLSGDFKNSYLDFYKESKGQIAPGINGSDDQGGGKFYPDSDLDYQVNYEVPVCFDTREIHGVTNATSQDRYILTLSFQEKYSFAKIFEMYKAGELLV